MNEPRPDFRLDHTKIRVFDQAFFKDPNGYVIELNEPLGKG